MNSNRSSDSENEQHSIYRPDEQKILFVISERLEDKEGDTQEERAEKRFRRACVQRFLYGEGQGQKKRLTYETLPAFIKETGLSWREVLELIRGGEKGSRELHWALELERDMCRICDALTDKVRERLYSIILELLPEPLLQMLNSDDLPDKRVFDSAILRRKLSEETWGKIQDDIMLRSMYVARNNPQRARGYFRYGRLQDVVDRLDVSFHWILNMDEITCILAAHGKTELIMDAYCLLPEQWKHLLLGAAEQCLRERE